MFDNHCRFGLWIRITCLSFSLCTYALPTPDPDNSASATNATSTDSLGNNTLPRCTSSDSDTFESLYLSGISFIHTSHPVDALTWTIDGYSRTGHGSSKAKDFLCIDVRLKDISTDEILSTSNVERSSPTDWEPVKVDSVSSHTPFRGWSWGGQRVRRLDQVFEIVQLAGFAQPWEFVRLLEWTENPFGGPNEIVFSMSRTLYQPTTGERVKEWLYFGTETGRINIITLPVFLNSKGVEEAMRARKGNISGQGKSTQ